jgi:protein-disulfide isomerase
MRIRWEAALAATLLALATTADPAGPQTASPQLAPGTPAAKVGDQVIPYAALEAAVGSELTKIEAQRHALLEDKLEQLIAERLLTQEARRRGIAVEALLQAEVDAKAAATTEAEVTAFITANRSRLPWGDEPELRRKVAEHLRAQRVTERWHVFVHALRTQGGVEVYLEPPSGARFPVTAGRGFVRGHPAAPVTIVEFTDFHCPFCKSVTATLAQLLARYPGQVKLVFRDYPIVALHPDAPKAHEAARCAGDQGKFWEYHDLLFDGVPRQTPADLSNHARALGLDVPRFAQCLESGRQQTQVSRDVEEGASLGVEATPTFFINGRRLVGAVPLSVFERIVDRELARATRR